MVNFNNNALSFFSAIKYDSPDAMVQKDGTGTKNSGIWNKHDINRWNRSSDDKKANNEIRTELLKSLGRAFGISDGIGTDNEGRTTFSKEFMNKLERILGPEFKRGDFFGMFSSSGAVNSGKPLTQRRISAILAKAAVVGKTDFNIDVYTTKAEAMLAKAKTGTQRHEALTLVKTTLDFLKKELPTLIHVNSNYDPEYEPGNLLFDTKYCISVPKQIAEQDPDQMKPVADGGKMLYESGDDVVCKFNRTDVQNLINAKFGFLLHIADGLPNVDPSSDEFPGKLNGYVTTALSTFAKTAIDLLEDTNGKPLANEVLSDIMNGHGCIEGRTSDLLELQTKHRLLRTAPNEAPVDLNMIDNAADHDEKTPLVKCMFKEVEIIMRGRNNETPQWDKCKSILEEKLVGLKRPLNEGEAPQEIKQKDIEDLKSIFLESFDY